MLNLADIQFLANEQVNLRVNIHNRAQALLQAAQQMETSNRRTVINNIVNETINSVDKTLADNSAFIKEKMFESALIGIRSKKMSYENDPILPLVKQAISANVKKVTALTEEEQTKLITLSGDQLNTLKALDER